MLNKEDINRKGRIDRDIERTNEQIILLQEHKEWLIASLDQEIKKATSITINENNCFVHEYHMCNYCFSDFDWGKSERHFYDQDDLDICVNCYEDHIERKK
jgi:hypothetical protein